MSSSFDPYALSPDAIASPPAGWKSALRQIGPGLILAGSIVGTGELIATTHVGARAGFVLLWLVILSCFIKVFVQAELGRYAISSGQTTLASLRQIGPVGIVFGWWWLAMMLGSQLQVATMIGGVGQALHMAVPAVSGMTWAVVTAVGTSLLLALGGYGLVEKGSTLLVAVFTIMTVGCVALLPSAGHPIDWSSVASGLVPTIPADTAILAAALAMFGITGVGATELVSYPYWCIEKGYARKTGPRDASPEWVERARGWIRVMKLDAWLSMGVYTVATLAFYFLGAAVLFKQSGQGLPGTVEGMLNTLATMYSPVLGQTAAKWFIIIGVLAVLYSTLYAATAANSRTLADFLRTHGSVQFTGPASRRRWVRAFCILFPIVDLGLFVALKNPVKMVVMAGIVQALTLPMLAAAAIYLRYRKTDERLRPGRLWDAMLWLSMAGLCMAAAYPLYDSLRKMGW